MSEISDKLLLLLCCTTLYILQVNFSFVIVPIILGILISSLFVYYEKGRLKMVGNLIFAVLCLFVPEFILFLPLILYDILHTKYQNGMLLVPILFLYHRTEYSAITVSLTIVLLVVSYLLKYKTDLLNTLKAEYNELRDNTTAMSLLLEEKNRSLQKDQDYEINLATLNERNRISKEIHDNIGHLLSRALLQIGALLTITKEEITQDGLAALKDSLSGGLDQIRNSIHHMYDESIDLYVQIEHLSKEFTFCSISYEYDIKTSPQIQLKHCIIGITKEALSNIIHHSNATKVTIILREHPAMYQLVIQDNGTMNEKMQKNLDNIFSQQEFGEGMGLRNISERVKSFGGNINLSADNGFKLFITFPKNNNNK
jgi:signal transduction histidine kinase